MNDIDYMNLAVIESKKSMCVRIQVGCVIVKDNEVLVKTCNGTGVDCRNIECIRDELGIKSGTRREVCRSLCAEQEAISYAASNGINIKGSTIYINTFPCHICAKLLYQAGIKKIYYRSEYDDPMSRAFIKFRNIDIERI